MNDYVVTPPCPETVSLGDIDISRELLARPVHAFSRTREIAAIYGLAAAVNQGASRTLKRLSKLAIELCCADSAGVSVLESTDSGEIFRWAALAGKIEIYEGGSTPRSWSPCGESLNADRAMLYSFPERYFTYLKKLELPIVEALVIPIYSNARPIATIWIVSHTPARLFDAEHVRIMTSLGSFAASALQMKSGEATRTETPQECSSSARLNETPHLAREIVWAEYLRRVATRDEFALEALFQETHALVFATALRIASFRSDAEEIAADVFVRVWASAASYDVRRGPVGAWLVRIARNCAVDQLRAAAVRQRCETGLLSRCVSCAPEATIDVEQTKASLARALQGLSVMQRRAIELFYFSELPVADIAAALRCPVGTVKTRLRTGVLNLRRLMAALESAGPVCPSTPVAARLAGFSPSCAHSVNLTSAVNP